MNRIIHSMRIDPLIGAVLYGILPIFHLPNVRAQIMAVESTYDPGGTYYSIPIDSTYGWKFRIGATPITVTRVGFFDAGLDGLLDSHQIGVWDTGGNLVLEGTVPSGSAAALVGAYRFELVSSPVTLNANTTY